MRLTEKQWGGYKGKYLKHNVDIHFKDNDKWKFKVTKDESHIYDSEWQGNNTFFESKEKAAEAAKRKIDEILKS